MPHLSSLHLFGASLSEQHARGEGGDVAKLWSLLSTDERAPKADLATHLHEHTTQQPSSSQGALGATDSRARVVGKFEC